MDSAPRITRSGSEKRQRQARPSMRCSAGEYALLEAAADRAGMTIGAFMRHQCLGTAGPRAARRPPIERAALAQLLAQLGKCGSNLNQIARRVNQGESPNGPTRQDIAVFIKVCTVMAENLKSTLKINQQSWEAGYDTSNR